MSAKYFRVDASNPLVRQAMAYNHLSAMPANWVMDNTGTLRLLDPEGTLGPQVAIDVPHPSNIWKEVLHALPYAAGAMGAGAIGGVIAGGGGAAGAAAGGSLAGIEGGTAGLSAEALAGLGTGAMGAVPVGAGIAGATGAGLASTAIGSGMAPAITGGAGLAEAGGALGSTAIGSGMVPAITGGTSGAGMGATGTTGSLLGAAGKFVSGGNGLKGYLDTAQKIGDALGAIGDRRAANRVAESNLNGAQDRNAIDLYRAQLAGQQTGLQAAQTDLNRRNYTLDAPGKRAGNSVRGDILANAQDANVEGIPGVPSFKFSGGLRPSMFSANTRQLGSDMSSQALSQQEAGDNFDPLPTAPTSPNLTPLPQSGLVDSIFNTAGAVSSLAPLMGSIPYGRQQAKQRPDLIPSDENGYG